MRKRITVIAGICFFSAMLILTLCSRSIYRSKLPAVRIGYPEQRMFIIDGEYHYLPALPESLVDSDMYCVVISEKNKEVCYLVGQIQDYRLGEESDGYYPVLSGISEFDPLILDYEGTLTKGQEVYIENEEEFIR